MPLLDLQTQFKSLTYQGNGPAIQKDINNPGVKANNPIQARVDDLARVSSFLFSTRGAIFAGKQALLGASIPATKLANPNLDPEDRLQVGREALASAAIATSRIANMLAQVPVNGTGTHFLPSSTSYRYTNATDAAAIARYGGVIKIQNVRSSAEKGRRVSLETKYLMDAGNVGETIGGPQSTLDQEAVTDPTFYDTMPVVFQVYNDPSSLLMFRGYVTGLSDSYNGAWSPVDYVGRAESLYTYSKFARSVTFTLTVPVLNIKDQLPLYEKVNSLVSYTAPKYNLSGLPEGTFLKL
jgi:hypothetical protein